MKPDRSLRFCMITTFYPPYNFGGDGIFVHRLSNELARRGHNVEVIHCIDAYRLLAGREPEEGYQDHPRITVHGLSSPFGFLSPIATQQTGLPLFKASRIRKILGKGFDVIHYHNISLVGGPKILEYGRAVKLCTMHEYWLVCPTHMLFKDNRAPCERPECVACTLSHKRPPQWWRYFGLLEESVKHVDVFIAPSRFSRKKHLEMGFDFPIVHLPYFNPGPGAGRLSSRPAASEEPYFLFVGRLEKIKGLQTLIPLFKSYRKAQLLVAGSGSYEPALREMAAGCANIQFLGRRSSQELEALYREAVAVIVPSIWFEVFGQVIIEAFAQKTPVIARNIGEMPAIIAESGGGIAYDTEDELIAAMDRLLEDPALGKRFGLCGYQAYRLKWTAEAHLRGYLGLIRDIMETRGQPVDQAAVQP
jgi:glycosyltransferase involved in cell wall biosynthesis